MIFLDALRKSFKTVLMLLSMVLGVRFYEPLVSLDEILGGWTSPALLSVMLFISCCGVDFVRMRLNGLHFVMLALQLLFSVAVYVLTLPLDLDVARGILICTLTPIAITAVVIAKFLGAKVGNIIAFSLLSNVVAAIYLPFILSHMCGEEVSTWQILGMVMPVIIIPMFVSQVVRCASMQLGEWISQRNGASLGLWLLLILFIFARTRNYFEQSFDTVDARHLVEILLGSLIVCIAQFWVGSVVGKRMGDGIAGAQALGQKNTILAVWLASSFISPIAALAPTAYIVWQNIVNTYRIFRHDYKRGSISS